MARKSFDRELQGLQDDVLVLGSVVEKAIAEAVQALQQQDHKAARDLIARDRAINEKRYAIEGDALTLIARQQPLASDLRTIFTVLEIATELERIGDYAKGIAKVGVLMDGEHLLKPFAQIPRMADLARRMLQQALEAFVQRDAALARAIGAQEQEMDALHNAVYRELLSLITADPDNVDRASYLLWVAHNLERTADRVLNICERVIFTVTGEMVEMDVEEGEDMGLEALS